MSDESDYPRYLRGHPIRFDNKEAVLRLRDRDIRDCLKTELGERVLSIMKIEAGWFDRQLSNDPLQLAQKQGMRVLVNFIEGVANQIPTDSRGDSVEGT
jgi:hypothetical protein